MTSCLWKSLVYFEVLRCLKIGCSLGYQKRFFLTHGYVFYVDVHSGRSVTFCEELAKVLRGRKDLGGVGSGCFSSDEPREKISIS